ncbi:MAG: hypothetical protein ACK5KO_04590 [Arachnia sp.]
MPTDRGEQLAEGGVIRLDWLSSRVARQRQAKASVGLFLTPAEGKPGPDVGERRP